MHSVPPESDNERHRRANGCSAVSAGIPQHPACCYTSRRCPRLMVSVTWDQRPFCGSIVSMTLAKVGDHLEVFMKPALGELVITCQLLEVAHLLRLPGLVPMKFASHECGHRRCHR